MPRPFRLLFLLLVSTTGNGGLSLPCAGQDLSSNVDLNLSGSGARATGMGGAFIAVADDATAAMWNPAGLTQLERPEVSLVSKVLLERVDLTGYEGLLDPTETLSGHLVADFGSFVYPIRKGDHKLVMAISYQQLLDFFDTEVAFFSDRALDLNFRGRGSALAPGFALRLFGPLAAGGSLNIWFGDLDLHVRGVSVGPSTPETFSSSLKTDFSGTNGTFGLLMDFASLWPSIPVKVGGVYRQPFDLDFDSKVRMAVDSLVAEEVVEGEVEMPWMLGMGVSLRLRQNLTFAVDYERIRFSHSLVNLEGNDSAPIGSSGPSDDTSEVRAGAEYALVQERFLIPVRGGLRYSPPPDVSGPGSAGLPIDEERWVWAAGAGYAAPRFSLDTAVEWRRWQTRKAPQRVDKFRQLTLAFSAIVYF